MSKSGALRPFVSGVQRGTITLTGVTSNTATITSISTANSVVSYLGISDASGAALTGRDFPIVQLTSATVVTATRQASDDASAMVLSFEVVTFFPNAVANIQAGLISADLQAATATITSVATNSSYVFWGGAAGSFSGSIPEASDTFRRLTLTSGTVVTGTRGNTSGSGVTTKCPFTVVTSF